MRRILVVGSPGAGKSTFARRLGAKLGLPVIHLDFYFWQRGWQLPDMTVWRERLTALVAAPEWVMDGNYADTFDIRLPRADTMAWLDYPRGICMRRIILRVVKEHGRTRADLPEGCPEQFDLELMRFVWSFPREQRRKIVAGIERFGGHLRAVRFADDRDADGFLAAAGRH